MGNGSIAYSVVIPVYRSEATLPTLYERLVRVLEEQGKPFELIFVEDCGLDGSWQMIQELAQQDARVTGFQLMRNFGQSAATMCGLRAARGSLIITIDDDLQNPPEEIPVLTRAMMENPDMDVVIGVPREKQHSLWRRMGSDVLNRVNSIIFTQDQRLRLTNFRIIRRGVVGHLLARRTPNPAPGAMLCTITRRMMNIEVEHHPRMSGKSGYTLAKLFWLTLSRILNFSNLPLRMLAALGMLGIFTSASLGIYYLAQYFVGGTTLPGFTTLVLILTAFSGFTFFAFGIMGEYLLRILQAAEENPSFIIRQQVRKSSAEGKSGP